MDTTMASLRDQIADLNAELLEKEDTINELSRTINQLQGIKYTLIDVIKVLFNELLKEAL